MIYLNIWNDIHPMVSKHGNDYMLNKLIDLNKLKQKITLDVLNYYN